MNPLVEALSAAGATLSDLRMLRAAPADIQERMLDHLGVRNPLWRMRLVFAAAAVPAAEEAGAESSRAAGNAFGAGGGAEHDNGQPGAPMDAASVRLAAPAEDLGL